MTDAERRRKEGLQKTVTYATENGADFRAGSIQATQIAVIAAELALMAGFTVDQAVGAGGAGSAFETKDTARETLREEMAPIPPTARAMERTFDGITERFKMPRNRTDQDTLATARAWVIASVPFEADFIAYGLPADFRKNLTDAADAFENSIPATTSAVDARVAATAQIGESIRRAMIALRILDPVMKNIYAGNIGKLAAWLSASHIEKAPKKKTPAP